MSYANTYPGVNDAALGSAEPELAPLEVSDSDLADNVLFTRVAGAAAMRSSMETPDYESIDQNGDVNAFTSAMQRSSDNTLVQ
jgi:hypothetical protein